ncbi:hypothetical protein BSK56_32875 [Paenibacillus borealis]|uniref:Uncharacterized protein n=1 Tax=Paenibacillus borealis TaxID=160799 RepID=A0ABX3GSG4_PAEBO|nr:hypothetical protein BSK56_32875 [Paenibacillus borealis]
MLQVRLIKPEQGTWSVFAKRLSRTIPAATPAVSIEQGLEEEEAFVVGFLEEYRFIKELQRSGGGLTLV